MHAHSSAARSALTLLLPAALTAVALAPPASAEAPRTPIRLEMKVTGLEAPTGGGEISIEVVCLGHDAASTQVELMLPEGIEADASSWKVDLKADTSVTLNTAWRQVRSKSAAGNGLITGRANWKLGDTSSWGDIQSIPISFAPGTHVLEKGWRVDTVPVATQVEPGDAAVVSLSPTPFSFPAQALLPPAANGSLPSKEPSRMGDNKPAEPPAQAATVTLFGKWEYQDRSNVGRDVEDELVEIRRADGSRIGAGVFCWTNFGDFSCALPHPGTNMRVWVWSWTSLNPGPSRLGVFSGPNVTGGCGSDNLDCAYPVQTGEIACADGTSCNVGTWTVNSGEPHRGAHQMTQDMIRAFKKILFDNWHGAFPALPGRISYPSTLTPQFQRANEWIYTRAPFQTSADVTVHEYGHAVMFYLWRGFTPNWPTSDCPSPHNINEVTAAGCALSEGFADFWSWYGNEFYDGDNNAANDGPTYNDPGFSINFETRDGNTWTGTGDQCEGDVAAAMGDMLDSVNEGTTPGSVDRVTDGVQHIWHAVSSFGANNFSGWYNGYVGLGHDPGPMLPLLSLNTIEYGWALNDACFNMIPVNSIPFTDARPVNVATNDNTDPFPGCGNDSRGKSVFYTYTATGPGTVTIDTFGTGFDTILSVFTGACGGLAGTGQCSDDAGGTYQSQVSFPVAIDTTYTIMVTAYNNDGGALAFHLNFTAQQPANDSCYAAMILPPSPAFWNDQQYTNGATNTGEPNTSCGNGSNAHSVWYRYTAPYDGRLLLHTTSSNYDTIILVFEGGCDNGGTRFPVPGGCNDDASPNSGYSSLLFNVRRGTTYWIMVSDWHNVGGRLAFQAFYQPYAGHVSGLDVTRQANGELTLAWGPSCVENDTAYDVYEGAIGSWNSHTVRACAVGQSRTITMPPAGGNTYYLVAPLGSQFEGSLGQRSSGVERPVGSGACWGQGVGSCAPACGHDVCQAFTSALDPSCHGCVSAICANDPFCCYGFWDLSCEAQVLSTCGVARCPSSAGSCGHTLCSLGGPLWPGCDTPPLTSSCVAAVCANDSYCCDPSGGWDGFCTSEVTYYCGLYCQGP